MPPRIETQRPPAKENDRPKARPGSILSRGRPASSMADPIHKLLIYGANRVGKTTLACRFPKPLLLIDLEPGSAGGAESIRREKGVTVLRLGLDFKDSTELVQVAEELAADVGLYRWFVLDGATSVQDLVLKEILGVSTLPDQLGYGTVTSDQYRARSERTREVLRPFLDLRVSGIILAKEKDHNPPKEERVSERTGKVQPDMRPRFLRGLQSESFIAAEIGGATVSWLQDCCSGIMRMYVEQEVKVEEVDGMKIEVPTGKYTRFLRTGYHPNYAAGIRSSNPEQVREWIEAPTPDKILKLLS